MIKELCLAAIFAFTSLVTPLDLNAQIKQPIQQKQFNKTASAPQNAPTRVGKKGNIMTSLEKKYSFDEASAEADIVAEVEISEWLKEIDEEDQFPVTFYKAKLLNVYKNSIDPELKEVIVLQIGNSQFTVEDYPLFQNGDKLILFLTLRTNTDDKNNFWILGSHSTVFTVKNIGNTEYVAMIKGDFSELNDISVEEPEGLRNYITTGDLTKKNESVVPHQTFIKESFESQLKNSIERARNFQ